MGSCRSRLVGHAMGRRSTTDISRTSGMSCSAWSRSRSLSTSSVRSWATGGGITTPFVFSSMALDLSSSSTKRLMRTFINACADPRPTQHRFREETRFAGPHELVMLLRWGLGRLVRIADDGQEERGLISWDHYTDFRDSELAANFPSMHISLLQNSRPQRRAHLHPTSDFHFRDPLDVVQALDFASLV
ncbi:hypothetical protein F5146DRAFT_1091013 [Armillaria mellea]|nr:hypothetical protein F5146DRAFT_1091003 [Armillaria mellea]KAK0183571.1 hypothetical protein F5146DRAFT_1091013 [Armillaria mellea]